MASNQLKNSIFFWAIKTAPFPNLLKSKLIKYNRYLPLWVKTKEGLFSISTPESVHPLLYLYHQLLTPHNIAISYFPEGSLTEDLLEQFTAIFGYDTLSMKEIIHLTKKEIQLPPKSTCLHPKLPTGLFLAPLSAD